MGPMALVLDLWACATHKAGAPPPEASATAQASPQAQSTPEPPPGPGASVNISYARPGDYLKSFSVTKFVGARLLTTRKIGPGQVSSISILSGGVPVWEFHAGSGLLSHFGFDKQFAVDKVFYGALPKSFVQETPPSGPPEPLEPESYYVFSVTRNSGSQSYEVVKVNDDGSLQGYAAQSLAGSSYELCCDLSPEFFSAPDAH